MKKIMVIFVFLILNFIMFTTTVTAADSRVVDIDTEDPLTMYNELYWIGDDSNPISLLQNSSDAAEEAWLEALLGLVYDDNTVSLIDKTELFFDEYGNETELIGLTNFDPGFNWDYAIVKLSNDWYAFADDFDDELLTTPEFDNSISHVSWFDPVTPVPEPATMLLFGSGLIALAGFGKKIRSKR